MITRDLFDYSDWTKEDLAVFLGPCPPEHRAYRETYEWCSTNLEFKRLYPDQIMAVIGREILAVDPDLAIVNDNAKARCKERGYSEEDIVLVQIFRGPPLSEAEGMKGSNK